MQRQVYELISQQINDPIAQRRTCEYSWLPFAIFQGDIDFYDKIGPTINGNKYPCLPPIRCPHERRRQKLSFRNNKKLYKRNCDKTGKSIISMYSSDKPYTIYHQDVWYSDDRDPMDYGKDYDPEKGFFDQYNDLLHLVPKMALINVNTENSQYSNYIADAKNCYMSSIVYRWNENIYYSFRVMHGSKDCSDLYNCSNAELSISCSDCINIYASYYLHGCNDCQDCYFSSLLKNCSHCLFCHNLINKNYYIHNKPVSKQEYTEYLNKIKSDENFFNNSFQIFQQLLQQQIVPALHMINCHDSIGNNLINCKNTIYSSWCEDFENCRYSRGENAKDVRDV